MSLYYSLIFAILVVEIAVFTLLALPIPTKFRRPLTLVLLKPFKNSNVQVAIKCILCFILLLFIDSINKVYNINKELSVDFAQGHEKIELLSRKFFQQRNLYLTGITLFLTFIVTKTFALVNELLNLKTTYRKDDNLNKKDLTVEELKKLIREKEDMISDLQTKASALEKSSEDL